MQRVTFILLISSLLGACSSVPTETLAMRQAEVATLDNTVTPGGERNRLIEMLNSIKLSHYKDAVREIEGR